MPCHNCGRTFLEDRLVIHLKSCDKAYAKKGAGVEDNSSIATRSTASLTKSINGSLSAAG